MVLLFLIKPYTSSTIVTECGRRQGCNESLCTKQDVVSKHGTILTKLGFQRRWSMFDSCSPRFRHTRRIAYNVACAYHKDARSLSIHYRPFDLSASAILDCWWKGGFSANSTADLDKISLYEAESMHYSYMPWYSYHWSYRSIQDASMQCILCYIGGVFINISFNAHDLRESKRGMWGVYAILDTDYIGFAVACLIRALLFLISLGNTSLPVVDKAFAMARLEAFVSYMTLKMLVCTSSNCRFSGRL